MQIIFQIRKHILLLQARAVAFLDLIVDLLGERNGAGDEALAVGVSSAFATTRGGGFRGFAKDGEGSYEGFLSMPGLEGGVEGSEEDMNTCGRQFDI